MAGESTRCTIETVERHLTAVVKLVVPMAEIPQAQRSSRAKIAAAMQSLDLTPIGHGCTLWRPPAETVLDMEPGVLVPRAFEAVGDVVPSKLPPGRAARLLLVGGFELLPGAWRELLDWCAAQKLVLAGVNWEVYGPWDADPATRESSLFALLA